MCNKQPGDKSQELIYNRTKRWGKKEKLKHMEDNICRSNIHLEGVSFHSLVFY